MSENAVANFRRIAIEYGVPFGRAAWHAYEAWCAANPQSRICGSAKSIRAFFQAHPSPATARPSLRASAGSNDLSVPVAIASNFRVRHSISCSNGNLVLRGTDFLTNVSTAGTVSSGTIVVSTPFGLNSSIFVGTRAAVYAGLFERWRPRRLKIHYQPGVSTATAGQLICAFDNDPSDVLAATGASAVRELASYESNVMFSVYTPAVLSVDLHSKDWLYTTAGADPRLYTAGNLLVGIVSAPPAATALGSLWCEYEIEFDAASELAPAQAPSFGGVIAGARWAAFTTVANTSFFVNATTGYTGLSFQMLNGQQSLVLLAGSYLVKFFFQTSGVGAGSMSLVFGAATGQLPVQVAANVIDITYAASGDSCYYSTIITIPPTSTGYLYPSTTTAVNLGGASFTVRTLPSGTYGAGDADLL